MSLGPRTVSLGFTTFPLVNELRICFLDLKEDGALLRTQYLGYVRIVISVTRFCLQITT